MMRIRVISLHGQPLAQEIAHDFDEAGGTLGRAETNQLALPDAQRHISRLQGRIVCRAGRFELINQGANPINVDGRPVANGSAAPIGPGTRIEIGGYLMEASGPPAAPPPQPRQVHPSQEVTISPEAFAAARRAAAQRPVAPPLDTGMAPQAASVPAPQPVPAARPAPVQAPPQQMAPAPRPLSQQAAPSLAAGPVDDPLGLFGGAPAGAADPFADILNGVTASPSPQSLPQQPAVPVQPAVPDPLAGAWSPPTRTPTESESLSELLAAPLPAEPAMPNNRAPLIPDDFDPFADPFAAPPKAAEPETLDDDLGFGLAGKSGSGSSIDTAYGLAAPPPVGNGIDPFLGSSLSDPLAGRGGDAPIDPLAAFSGDLGAPIPGFQSMPDQVPELHGAFVPPRVEPFAAPEPGAFAADTFAPPQQPRPQASPRVDAAGNGQFVSWETQSQSAPPAPPPSASRPAAAADPLLSMFDAPSGGASQSDVLGLGVAPVPGDDMLAAFDALPNAAPLAGLSPMPPMPSMPPQSPAPPPAAPLVDFNSPTLPGDDTFFAGIAQAPVTPAPASPQPAAPLVARAFEEMPAAAPARAAQAPAPVGDASAEALRRAFLAGLGTPTLPLDALTPETMERVGRLLREATQGTLDLLLARATTKREVRADVTMIVSADNNPLKFSPDVAAALLHLLVPQGPGFLSPVAAMQDAYDDLRSHQFGFMAGLRAALAGVLKRFDPAMLEQRMAQKSMLDNVLPMNRRAKLWDLYIQLYRDIANEAEDDFHTLFGREFLRAYQEQVDRLGKSQ